MRIVLRKFFIIALLAVTSIAWAPSVHANSVITLWDPPHQQLDGRFFDDDLAQSLTPTGRLGTLVFSPPAGTHLWAIDAMLIEEVTAMSTGYSLNTNATPTGQSVALDWLNQLKIATATDSVEALPYGNPSGYWIHRLSPHDQDYFLAAGQIRLQVLLNRPVAAMNSYPNRKYFALGNEVLNSYTSAAKILQLTATLLRSSELDNYRLRSAGLLISGLDISRRDFLARDLTSQMYSLIHKVRLVPGKFTITSSQQNVPVTIINDFSIAAKVQLNISALNGKVKVHRLSPVQLAPNSKTQVLVPIEVLTSGSSGLAVDVLTKKGDLLGDTVLYPLNLAVISPVATWITTGAGLLLFIGAVVQSIRRIKRRGA
ncbi:MAG: DUF6049 family protein [Actinomycetes bacterium]